MIDEAEVALTAAQIAAIHKYDLTPGFEFAGPPAYPRLVCSVWGDKKTGKTSFALSFPKPIWVMNLDFGVDELFISRPELLGEVQRMNLQMNELTDPGTWGQLLQQFHDGYLAALEAAQIAGGTVIVDTATQLWQVIQAVKIEHVRNQRLAAVEAKTYANDTKKQEALERAQKPSQLDYGQANAFMGGLMRRAMHYDRASAVFINRAKPEYSEGGRPTGNMEYHGFGELPAISQVHIQLSKKGGTHMARINDCRFNSSLEGLEIANANYEIIRSLVLGE